MKRLSAATALAAGIAGVIVATPTTASSATVEPAPAPATADLARGWGDQLEATEAAVLEGERGSLARLGSPALRGGAVTEPSSALLTLLLDEAQDRAELIRNSITREGFVVEDADVTTSTVVTKKAGRVLVRITTTRTWNEIDPQTDESTAVGDSDVYVVEAPSVAATQSRSSSAALDVGVASLADSTEKRVDPVVKRPASSVARPKVARAEDGPVPSTFQQSAVAAAGEPSFDHEKFAAYGKKWTGSPNNGDEKEDFNPDYPYFGNNCANFVSQMFNKGGWKRTGGVNPNLDGNWDDDLTGPFGATDTWAGAASLYRYATDKKDLNTLGNIWNAVPGNTFFMDWDGNKKINHVAAVTGRTDKGTPRISQKTGNRHNMLLTTWKDKVDADNPNVLWYGLRRTTK